MLDTTYVYSEVILARVILLGDVAIIEGRPGSRSLDARGVLLELLSRQPRRQSRFKDVLAVDLLQRHVFSATTIKSGESHNDEGIYSRCHCCIF